MLGAGLELGAALGEVLGTGETLGTSLGEVLGSGLVLGASLGVVLGAGETLGVSLGDVLGAGEILGAKLGEVLGAGEALGIPLGAGVEHPVRVKLRDDTHVSESVTVTVQVPSGTSSNMATLPAVAPSGPDQEYVYGGTPPTPVASKLIVPDVVPHVTFSTIEVRGGITSTVPSERHLGLISPHLSKSEQAVPMLALAALKYNVAVSIRRVDPHVKS